MVSEKSIEQKLRMETKKMGGWAVKFSSPGLDGMPDRLVLFPGGKLGFVELKAPGKQMRPLQRKRRKQLEALGFPVFCVDSMEQIQPAIRALAEWNPGEPIPTGIGVQVPEIENTELPAKDTEAGKGDDAR